MKYVADGNTINDSAVLSRIDRQTVYARRERDPEFAHDLDVATMATKTDAIQTIKRAWKGQWQAAGWWLERRHPDEFALKSKDAVNINFIQNEKLKEIDNDKLIEVVINDPDQIENKPE